MEPVPIANPSLSLEKTLTAVNGSEDVTPVSSINDMLEYTITVVNTGNVTLDNVAVMDDNADIIVGSPITRLRPGESVDVIAQHVVTQDDIDAGQVVNQAKVTGEYLSGNKIIEELSDDPDTPEEGDPTITQIVQNPGIRIDKRTASTLVYREGEQIQYELEVVNTGNVSLRNVLVTDPLTGFSENIAIIRPGAANAFTFHTTYTVTMADILEGAITNTGVVMADDPAGNRIRNEDVVVVPVHVKVIEAKDDGFEPVNGRKGGEVGNVLTNDTMDGNSFELSEVKLTRVPWNEPSSLILHPDGTVSVAPNTPAGIYTLEYQICDVFKPNNCETAMVMVEVSPAPIEAIVDAVRGVDGYNGTMGVTNVMTNDLLDGRPIAPEDVRLSIVHTDPNLRLNPDGSVDVLSGTRGGTYTLNYQICEVLNPDNCSQATVTVIIVNPLVIPNVFTPNGDGYNDYFEIIGIEGFDRIEITVINRWGNEVYANADYKNDWNGANLNEGTYYYLIRTYLGTQKRDYTGWLLIKRQ